ncbi:hypothetical protein Y1Q_0008289 [Alligator mississippiensis]|uniref:Uncharacterized protein n=1 Tax=Alligator mississippiensis TaxID=8496 RepID=A0A151N1M6_ALLMI|nr:hypothetical protein Y1Q_0008289 [Alligator mississippiensis]
MKPTKRQQLALRADPKPVRNADPLEIVSSLLAPVLLPKTAKRNGALQRKGKSWAQLLKACFCWTANDIRGKPMYGASKGCMIGIEVKAHTRPCPAYSFKPDQTHNGKLAQISRIHAEK